MNALLLRNLTKPEINFINSRDKYGGGTNMGERKKNPDNCVYSLLIQNLIKIWCTAPEIKQ